jgi:tyrosinase
MPLSRVNVYALDPNGPEIASLRKGFSVMGARDPADPTSLRFQANIHGTGDPDPGTAEHPLFNRCQHGSFFFLSWHRMYLYFFERILRAASGDPSLALPYWDYSNAAQGAVPAPYRLPADPVANPLFVAARADAYNQGSSLSASDVTYSSAFQYYNFFSPANSNLSFGGQLLPAPAPFDTELYGQLEAQPHNTVHTQIGGSQGWMSSHQTAARDPVFFLHHANIDRLWKRWLDQGGGRSNPTDNTAWMTAPFTFFDESGQQTTMSGADILDTVNQLGYQYDDDPPPVGTVPYSIVLRMHEAVEMQVAKAAMGEPRSLATQGGVEIGVSGSVVLELDPAAKDIFASVAQNEVKHRIALRLELVEGLPNPGVTYDIYLNPPVLAPGHQSKYYIATLGVFGMSGEKRMSGMARPQSGGTPKAVFGFDVTACVRALQSEDRWDPEKVSVEFVSHGASGSTYLAEQKNSQRAPRIRIARLSLLSA